MGELIAGHRPDLVVIACNTASTLVLPHLRERYAVPFVGTVPAIKPACAGSVTRRVSVLGTKATVQPRIHPQADPETSPTAPTSRWSARRGLPRWPRRHCAARPVADADVAAELAPCFVDEAGRRTDTIVLACTHFPLLLRPAGAAVALAGGLHRPGAGNRAARGRPDRRAGARRQRRRGADHVHLTPTSSAGTPHGAGASRN